VCACVYVRLCTNMCNCVHLRAKCLNTYCSAVVWVAPTPSSSRVCVAYELALSPPPPPPLHLPGGSSLAAGFPGADSVVRCPPGSGLNC